VPRLLKMRPPQKARLVLAHSLNIPQQGRKRLPNHQR
jgi:hypothetical protein